MAQYDLICQNVPVKVFTANTGYWKHDTVFFYNTKKIITKFEIHSIIEYLYDEGYIQDRRTKYMIADGCDYEI